MPAGPALIEIDHDPIPADAAALRRRAVRALIHADGRLLMVHSQVSGDYKFPGGGVEPGEAPDHALIREVSEECGREVTMVGPALLTVVERRLAREPGYAFVMESSYHECEIAEGEHSQRLDGYERELGFAPAWVGIGEALATNRDVLASNSAQTWVARETRVLAELVGLL